MKSYNVNDFSDMSPHKRDVHMTLPDLMPNQGVILHYHIYNVPTQDVLITPADEVKHTCHWRVVLPDYPMHSMKDVITLFADVIDRYHYYEEQYADIISFITCEATTCTNCGELDTVYRMIPCELCQAPLCLTCHEGQGYCNSHKN